MATYDDILGLGRSQRRIGTGSPFIDPRTYVNAPDGGIVKSIVNSDDSLPGTKGSEENGDAIGAANRLPAGAATGASNSAATGAAKAGTPLVRSVRRKKVVKESSQAGNGTLQGVGDGATPGPGNPYDPASPKQLSYVELFRQMNPYKPPTEKELKAEKRKQRRQAIFAAIGDGISALSNLYFTTQYSPNAYDAKQGMSPKMVERWDKLKKEREGNQRAYMDDYLRAKAMDDQKERDERNWKHTLEREEISDQRYDNEIKHRGEREKIDDQRYDDNIVHRDKREAKEDDRWEKQFKEGIRQFNVSSSQTQQRINLEAKRLSNEIQNNNGVTFTLGIGKGTVTIPKAALNDSNVAFVFNKLPEVVRSQVKGKASKVKNGRGGKEEIVYGPPTTEAMLIAIGANIETCPEAQAALKEVAGQKQTSNGKGKGY